MSTHDQQHQQHQQQGGGVVTMDCTTCTTPVDIHGQPLKSGPCQLRPYVEGDSDKQAVEAAGSCPQFQKSMAAAVGTPREYSTGMYPAGRNEDAAVVSGGKQGEDGNMSKQSIAQSNRNRDARILEILKEILHTPPTTEELRQCEDLLAIREQRVNNHEELSSLTPEYTRFQFDQLLLRAAGYQPQLTDHGDIAWADNSESHFLVEGVSNPAQGDDPNCWVAYKNPDYAGGYINITGEWLALPFEAGFAQQEPQQYPPERECQPEHDDGGEIDRQHETTFNNEAPVCWHTGEQALSVRPGGKGEADIVVTVTGRDGRKMLVEANGEIRVKTLGEELDYRFGKRSALDTYGRYLVPDADSGWLVVENLNHQDAIDLRAKHFPRGIF